MELETILEKKTAFKFKGTDAIANSLDSFNKLIFSVPNECIQVHLENKDFSTWILNSFKDTELAEKIRKIEEMPRDAGCARLVIATEVLASRVRKLSSTVLGSTRQKQ